MFLKKLFSVMLRELSYSVFKERFESYAAPSGFGFQLD